MVGPVALAWAVAGPVVVDPVGPGGVGGVAIAIGAAVDPVWDEAVAVVVDPVAPVPVEPELVASGLFAAGLFPAGLFAAGAVRSRWGVFDWSVKADPVPAGGVADALGVTGWFEVELATVVEPAAAGLVGAAAAELESLGAAAPAEADVPLVAEVEAAAPVVGAVAVVSVEPLDAVAVVSVEPLDAVAVVSVEPVDAVAVVSVEPVDAVAVVSSNRSTSSRLSSNRSTQ